MTSNHIATIRTDIVMLATDYPAEGAKSAYDMY